MQDVTNVDPVTGAVGDGDPIDVIELGDTPLPMGAVVKVGIVQKSSFSRRMYKPLPCYVQVRVLGSLALIDEGETDHKIIVVRDSDPKYADVASVAGTATVRYTIIRNKAPVF